MKIRVRKGLNLPLSGEPEGTLNQLPKPKHCALNLDPFDATRFKVLVKLGEQVKLGQPLVESKTTPGMTFVSPAGGAVIEIRRGLKRRLLDIVVEVADHEDVVQHTPLENPSRDAVLERLMVGGGLPHIRMRPFDLVASPARPPRAIFVKAIESAPFTPSAEQQIEGHEADFAAGLQALTTLATVHLVHRQGSPCKAFSEASGVERHTVSGPHPAGNVSLHIHNISPIIRHEESVWTLSAVDVITVGRLIAKGDYFVDRLVGIGGSGLLRGAFVRTRAGAPIEDLISGRLKEELLCLISGDLLSGTKVEMTDFLGFYHTTVSVLPVSVARQPFHFLRPGFGKFTATRTYASGFMKGKRYPFDTNQHGEERAFIDGAVYDRVMPLRVPTMQLVKAVMSEDYELAEQLGLLEVAPEDFALTTFICPSKIEMMDIMKQGLHHYSKELGM